MKKWYDVYQGNDERAFFVGKDGKSGLVRSSYNYRSVAALAKESGLSKGRVEQIVSKYLKMGLVVASSDKEDHYAYWGRVSPGMTAGAAPTVAVADQNNRINKASSSKKP
jgi:hypothetical protein